MTILIRKVKVDANGIVVPQINRDRVFAANRSPSFLTSRIAAPLLYPPERNNLPPGSTSGEGTVAMLIFQSVVSQSNWPLSAATPATPPVPQ